MKYIGRTNEFGLFSEDGSGYYGYFIVIVDFGGLRDIRHLSCLSCLSIFHCIEYVKSCVKGVF